MIEPQTIEDQIRFCEVPAPPFKERARGEVLRQAFQQAGLRNVRFDRVGNVLGDRPGMAARPHVVLAAHLDTVFPEETDVKVRRDGAILWGPGIGDDCRGLAVLVAIARALRQANVQTAGSAHIRGDGRRGRPGRSARRQGALRVGDGRRPVRRDRRHRGWASRTWASAAIATGSRSRGRVATASPRSASPTRSMRWDGRLRRSRSSRCPGSRRRRSTSGVSAAERR